MLDVKRLQVLMYVVERGSVTAAAEALSYTPSAISQQLQRLEREVGQPLLERHPRGMVPTDAGHVLAGHARKVLRQLTAAESDLAEIADVRRGHLDLGTFPTVGSSFLPLAVQRYRQLYPSINLTIHSAREDQLIEKLEEGQVGMSLLWDYAWGRVDDSQLSLTTLFTDPTVLIVAADHRLARRKQVKMADLSNEQWIIRSENHPVVEVLQRSAVAAGFTPKISFWPTTTRRRRRWSASASASPWPRGPPWSTSTPTSVSSPSAAPRPPGGSWWPTAPTESAPPPRSPSTRSCWRSPAPIGPDPPRAHPSPRPVADLR
jgi:DNA-binding transcriptional LysR family regulator